LVRIEAAFWTLLLGTSVGSLEVADVLGIAFTREAVSDFTNSGMLRSSHLRSDSTKGQITLLLATRSQFSFL